MELPSPSVMPNPGAVGAVFRTTTSADRPLPSAMPSLAVTVTVMVSPLSKCTAPSRVFADELASAGDGSTVFDTSVKGVNAIYDGLFYLETFVKDRKLGWPLGLRACGEEDCTDKVESVMAGKSNEWLAANLVGFRALYSGGELDGEEGIGMHELLVSVDEESLAEDVLTKLEAADVAVANLTDPINDSLTTDPDALDAAHAAVKALTDLLKVDIATVLALEVPAEAAGDND